VSGPVSITRPISPGGAHRLAVAHALHGACREHGKAAGGGGGRSDQAGGGNRAGCRIDDAQQGLEPGVFLREGAHCHRVGAGGLDLAGERGVLAPGVEIGAHGGKQALAGIARLGPGLAERARDLAGGGAGKGEGIRVEQRHAKHDEAGHDAQNGDHVAGEYPVLRPARKARAPVRRPRHEVLPPKCVLYHNEPQARNTMKPG
jgi:hypothetical protein